MSHKFQKRTCKIPSVTPGWNLDVWIYTPEGATHPLPVIVMGHGVGCIKILGLSTFAEAFSSAGYACVVFDYRRWGASDGTPRHAAIVADQLQDYRTVVKYCRQQPEFDPQKVILWGYSFAGGHVLTLAAESELNILATIAQCPYVGRPFNFSFSYLYLKRCALAILDFVKQSLGLSPVYIPNAGYPGEVAAMNAPGTVEGFASVENAEVFPNEISASIFLRVPLYQPKDTCHNIGHPVLLIASREDLLCPAAAVIEVSQYLPNAELFEIPGAHFDMFKGNRDHEVCLKAELDFLRKHVIL